MKRWKVLFLGISLVFMCASIVPAPVSAQEAQSTAGTCVNLSPVPGRAAEARIDLAATGRGAVLLIPEITGDSVGIYDPFDGTYLGDLIDKSIFTFLTPLDAILGPDGNLYVSDQVKDGVYVFDTAGNYLYTYADAADGLDNIRGIAFRGGHLFVTSHYGYIAEFDGPHSRLPDFIYDGTSSFWDIDFLSDNTCVVSAWNGYVEYYDASGNFLKNIIPAYNPVQVASDPLLPGAYLVDAFSAKTVYDFELDGTIVQSTYHGESGVGVFRLGNGNLLITDWDGVFEIDPLTGAIIHNERPGVAAKYIELIELTQDTLSIDQDTISEATGGVVNFSLDAGSAQAGRSYLLLGSVTGTSPGTPLPGGMAVLPLNWDLFTTLVIGFLNTPIFQNFTGSLDLFGHGAAVFDTLGPIPGTAGISLYFAYALGPPPAWDFASNPVEIKIVP